MRPPALRWSLVLTLAAAFVLSATVHAHPPGKKGKGHSHPHKHPHDHGETSEVAVLPDDAQLPSALVLPAIDGPKPWTDKPLFDDPDRFQIAIMTDRTGGHRPGIWEKAVEKVNLLRPAFVMSVGDLIEGYSEDRNEVEAEWKEFLGFMDKMEMKFFFVAGNHDLSNPFMHTIWREHFGPEWYSFDYKGVHFVAMSSEDPKTQIGDKQLAWLTDDLEKAKDARWTLLFMHKPLWVEAERELAAGNLDSTNWKKVEKLLGDRPHTVFAGHVHYYSQYDRNGQKYYHLATTGGSTLLRGVPYGEFDEVTWLTMEKEGPTVANLLLDGILPGNVVTEKSIARFRAFLDKTQVEVAPILLDDDGGLSQGRIDLRLKNGFDVPVEMSATIAGLPLRGLTVDPEMLKLSAEPGQTTELAVNVQFSEKIAFQHLAQTLLTASLKTTEKDRPLSAERQIPIVIDRKFSVPRVAMIKIDGNVTEWPDAWLPMPSQPLVLDQPQDWTGPEDCGVSIQAARDDKFLYLAARVTDERVLQDGDALTFLLDTRPVVARSADPRLRSGAYKLEHAWIKDPISTAKFSLSSVGGSPIVEGFQAAAEESRGGYTTEFAVPLELISNNQPELHSLQLTAVVSDLDEAGQKPARVLWRGTSDVNERNTNFGQFVLAP
jgi:hypothetical protein